MLNFMKTTNTHQNSDNMIVLATHTQTNQHFRAIFFFWGGGVHPSNFFDRANFLSMVYITHLRVMLTSYTTVLI